MLGKWAIPVIASILILGLIPFNEAFAVTEDQKLTASDAALGDNFGFSVSISGDTAIVGAFRDDDTADNSGSAYIFTRTAGVWTQQAKLTASDAALGDIFGRSVSISGDTAIVGAPGDDDVGSAYVFVKPGGGWSGNLNEDAKLTASDAAARDIFGRSVSISGDTAIVGAHQNDDVPDNSGSAYVFVKPGGGWSGNLNEDAKLTASDADSVDQFGISVSISVDTAIVGAHLNDDGGSASGSAYKFVKPGGGWTGSLTESAKLTASDAAAGDRFGESVSILGDTAIVGAQRDDDACLPTVDVNCDSGSAYVFDIIGPTVTITSSSGASGSTISSTTLSYTATFSESVSDFVVGDITVAGTANGGNPAASNFAGTGTTYTFDVVTGSSDGTVAVSVAAGKASDAAGNTNFASNTYDLTIDTTGAKQIKIPLRWCGVAGAPSIDNPGQVLETTTDDVLIKRHQRASDNIYNPQALMTFRSGTTAALPNFPILTDPDTTIGDPGDVFGSVEFIQLINNCKAAWAVDPTVTGIVAVHIKRFVSSFGTPISTGGLAYVTSFSSTASQLNYGSLMVVDNAFTLPCSNQGTPCLQTFPSGWGSLEKLLGHELGHTLTFRHGNGIDDDGDGVVDEKGEGDTTSGPNLMQYFSNGITITQGQSDRMRSQALQHIPDVVIDPVPQPLANSRTDALGDVPAGKEFIDIDSFGVAVDRDDVTTTLSQAVAGLFPSDISNLNYFFLADLDNNPSTGGSAADISALIGVTTTFQGAELVAQVQVDVSSGVATATPTVSKFQAGSFVTIIDPSIQPRVLTVSIGLVQELPLAPGAITEAEISQEIQLDLSNLVRGPMANDIQFGAIAQAPSGGIDTASEPLTFLKPTYPSCTVVPASANRGATVTVNAVDLPASGTAEVFVGTELVATGTIDVSGNSAINFNIPGDASVGQRVVTVKAVGTAITAVCTLTVPDDGDGVPANKDQCPNDFGSAEFNGCPVADKNNVSLHTVNLGGGGSTKVPLAGAEVRVFDRNDADFQATYGTKNPSGTIYDQVFESGIGQISDCKTDASGMCIAGETAVGDYLVIVKFDEGNDNVGPFVYTGLLKSPSDFENGLATKDFQIIKKIKKNGDVSFGGGKKVVVRGSILEVIYQDVAIWEPGVTSYIYPYIFTSDSDWTTDLCMYLPIGYEIVGVFDELGNLVTNEGCVQTFVAGETKVAAFEVVDIGSPKEFSVVVDLDAKSKKKPTQVTLITDTVNDNANGAKAEDKQQDKGQNKKEDKQQDKGPKKR